MLVQVIILAFIVFIISRLLVKFKARLVSIRELLLWTLFWVALGVVILLPETTSFLARKLGVGRGVDLAMYVAIIILFYIIFYLFLRLRRIEKDITKIVRYLAINDKFQNPNDK